MKILITNDDGVDSLGIRALANELKKIASVYIVAPERQQSTQGHSLTLHKPLRLIKVGSNIWKSNGTPIDCVKLGVRILLKNNVDLVVSGINTGANLGTDVLYSGTAAGAFEAAQMGIPSIAVSLVLGTQSSNFNFPSKFVRRLISNKKIIDIPHGSFLNVNVPNIQKKKIKGFKITKLGSKKYKDIIERRVDLRGRPYYWLAGEIIPDPGISEDTDIYAVEKGYVSLTPVKINLTDYDTLEWLKSAKLDINRNKTIAWT